MIDLEGEAVNPGQRRGIVFLHGFLGDKDEFKHIGRNFERTHSVVYATINPPLEKGAWGFFRNGTSLNPPTPFSKGGVKSWHLVGYSMGGRIALQIACRWPHLIKRLTLISASPGLENARERRARFMADRFLAARLQQASMREFLSYWYRQRLFKEFRAHPHFQELLARRLQHDPEEMGNLLVTYSTGALPSLWDELSRLPMPIELICGERDAKFCDIGTRMAKRNPQIHLTVVANVGHVVHWEAPNAVTQGIFNVENRMAVGQNL